jgi:hypothetical protein
MKSMIANLIDEEIFNSHFLSESDADFMKRICNQIFEEISYLKKFSPTEYNDEILEEIEDQVLEVYKTKTYGHLNLQHYRKVHRPKAKRVG